MNMDTNSFVHINFFNAIIGLYVLSYQMTICLDWSWIPVNESDYKLPYEEKLKKTLKELVK